MTCRNQECMNGRMPGLVVIPRSAKVPIIGPGGVAAPTHRWGWVPCPACNPDPKARESGISYKPAHRSPEEIARRKQLADGREMYKGELPIAKSLGSLKVSAPVPAVPALAPDHSAQLGKLIEQVTALTGQVSELLAENRQLRKQLEARPASEAQAPLQ